MRVCVLAVPLLRGGRACEVVCGRTRAMASHSGRLQAAARHVGDRSAPFRAGPSRPGEDGSLVPSAPARLPLYLASGAAGMINGENRQGRRLYGNVTSGAGPKLIA